MALAELVQKMKSKKQATARSAFGHYLEAVKELASGKEIDADEAGHILAAAGKSEDDFSRDVQLQQTRITWHARCVANQQATKDRVQAERDLQAAQAALQAAYDKLQPAIDQAHDRLNAANYRFMTTTQAEGWLAENVLDHELIDREQAVVVQLKIVNNELNPLLQDREHKRSSLMNADLCLRQITGRSDDAWPTLGTINSLFWRNKDTIPAQQRVDDLKNQLSQLEQAIHQRQQVQAKLQSELNEIHQEKLKP